MKIFLFLPGLLMFTSCAMLTPVNDAAVHHVLDPLVPDRALTALNPSMAISRPSIPGFLDCQQLVTHAGGQLTISSLDLWGEPLDAAISRVTASNLSRLTGSSNIQPVENFVTLDYRMLLELRISQFEPDASHQMVLEGTWKLQPVTGGQARSHFFRISESIAPGLPPVTARVDAMNQSLEKLARQIAEQL